MNVIIAKAAVIFAWLTGTPDASALDPVLALMWLTIIVALALAGLIMVALWPLGSGIVSDDPYARAFGDWPELPHGSVDREPQR